VRKIAPFLLLLLVVSASAQTTIPLNASRWVIDPKRPQENKPFQEGEAIAFNFPESPYADPFSSGPWLGYLVTPWNAPLRGQTLTATFTLETDGPKNGKRVRFNYVGEAANTCESPANVRFYFQTGDLYNNNDGSRWWSNPGRWVLVKGSNLATLTVDLSPQNFTSTYGHSGGTMPSAFWNAVNHPSYVGLTFGGGCFFGHGINVFKGSAKFTLVDYSTH